MPLPAVVDKIEDVAEPLREHYVKGADEKFHLSAEGIEDVTGLKSALKKERENAEAAQRALKENQKQFEGVDPKAYRTWLEAQEGDEEAKLFASGKKDELRSRWTAKMAEAHQKQIDKIQADHQAAVDAANKRTKLYEGRVLDNALRAATAEVEGFHKPATRDALLHGRSVFVLDDDGNAVQKREDGSVVIGKDGKSPFGPKEWLESQRTESPHWFIAAGSGTGASQSKSTNGSGQKTMSRADFARLTPQKQYEFIRKDGGALVDG